MKFVTLENTLSLCHGVFLFPSLHFALYPHCCRICVRGGWWYQETEETVGEKKTAGVGDLCSLPPNHSVLSKMSYQHFLFLSSVSMVTFLPSSPSICHLLFLFSTFTYYPLLFFFLTPAHYFFWCSVSLVRNGRFHGLKDLAPGYTRQQVWSQYSPL